MSDMLGCIWCLFVWFVLCPVAFGFLIWVEVTCNSPEL